MPSSIFVLPTIISLLLTLNLCSADGPSAPQSGPIPPGVRYPRAGWSCAFKPVAGHGPDATTPAYNAYLVSDYSISEFIQCADRQSKIGSNDDNQQPISALDVLVSATRIPACGKCKLGTTVRDYSSRKDKSVKLARYLCGKVDESDLCCLHRCIGAKKPEHSLKGICKNNDVDLWVNDAIDCGGGGGGGSSGGGSGDSSGGGGGGGGGGGVDNSQTAASSSTVVASASKPTVTPSKSSSVAAQTTLPTQTASSSPAGSSSSSVSSSIRAANIIASGLLVVILTAGILGAV